MTSFHYEHFPLTDTDTDRDVLDTDHNEFDHDDLDDLHRRQRPKIRRCRLTAHQLQTLSQVFEQDSQPSMETRIALGAQLGMETKQVSAWFQNKRQKLKNAPATPFPSSSVPSPSLARDLDSHPDYHQHTIYHSRELPQPDFNRYHQPYTAYARPHHRQPFNVIDHTPNYIDRYPPTHHYHDQYDMKPSTTTFQLPPTPKYINTVPAGSGATIDRMMTRSHSSSSRSRSRSGSTDSEYTRSTESVPSVDSYSDYLTLTASFVPQPGTKGREMMRGITKAKREPFDENHHSLALRVPTPPPEAVQSPVMKKSGVSATNRRTSMRARSARLAASPILTNNRHVSTGGSPAASHTTTGESQPKRLTRSRMSASQRAYLHSIYEQNPEPTMAERQVIADKLGVQIGKITNWFRNLRQSVRRGKLLDAKLTSTRATTVDSKAEDEDEDMGDGMEVEEDGEQSDDETRVSPSPAPIILAKPAPAIVPGKGAYSTHSLIAASEYAALHSPPDIYAEEDDDEEEEEHEALTPHPSPASKLAHSFGASSSTLNVNVSSNTPESPSSRGGICLPSISISLAESDEQDEKKQLRRREEQKFQSAYEDAMLLLHFRQNCDVRDIHGGVVVGRPGTPPMY